MRVLEPKQEEGECPHEEVVMEYLLIGVLVTLWSRESHHFVLEVSHISRLCD